MLVMNHYQSEGNSIVEIQPVQSLDKLYGTTFNLEDLNPSDPENASPSNLKEFDPSDPHDFEPKWSSGT